VRRLCSEFVDDRDWSDDVGIELREFAGGYPILKMFTVSNSLHRVSRNKRGIDDEARYIAGSRRFPRVPIARDRNCVVFVQPDSSIRRKLRCANRSKQCDATHVPIVFAADSASLG